MDADILNKLNHQANKDLQALYAMVPAEHQSKAINAIARIHLALMGFSASHAALREIASKLHHADKDLKAFWQRMESEAVADQLDKPLE